MDLEWELAESDLRDLADFGCDSSGCTVDGDFEAEPFLGRPVGLGEGNLREDPSSEFASTDPEEVQRFLLRPGAFAYEVVEVTAAGQIRNRTLRRAELLAATGLRPRDLRAVTVRPPPDTDAGPVLSGRRGTLVLGLGGVRAIVEPGRALLFGSPTPDRARFLRVLSNQCLSGAEPGNFRILFVESALLALSRQLGSRLLQARRATEPTLRTPPSMANLETDLESVRQQQRILVRCASQASAVSSALLSRLDTGDLVPIAADSEGEAGTGEASVEWETMLEIYLQTYSEISRQCRRLLADIEDFESSVSLTLQMRRLRVEQFELSLVITSVSVAAGGLLPSAMGMNLLSGQETAEGTFGAAILATLCICVSLFVVLRGMAAQRGFLG